MARTNYRGEIQSSMTKGHKHGAANVAARKARQKKAGLMTAEERQAHNLPQTSVKTHVTPKMAKKARIKPCHALYIAR